MSTVYLSDITTAAKAICCSDLAAVVFALAETLKSTQCVSEPTAY
jgi:hypothetical protein